MALDDLLEAVRSEAERDARGVVAEARTEAERIRAEGRGRLARRREDLLATLASGPLDAPARDPAGPEVVEARDRARARALTARAALLDRVFEAARVHLESAEGLERWLADALPAQIIEARRFLPEGELTVHCSPELAAAVRDAAGADAIVTPDLDGSEPRVVVRDASDHVRVDLSPRARLQAQRASLVRRLAEAIEAALIAPEEP